MVGALETRSSREPLARQTCVRNLCELQSATRWSAGERFPALLWQRRTAQQRIGARGYVCKAVAARANSRRRRSWDRRSGKDRQGDRYAWLATEVMSCAIWLLTTNTLTWLPRVALSWHPKSTPSMSACGVKRT